MTWLFEDPTMVLVATGFAIAGLLVAFLKTGRGIYLCWLGGMVLLALLAVIVERSVVTDRELVEDTLEGARTALEANDVDAMLAYLSPDAEVLRSEIRAKLPRLQIEEARIANLAIEFSPLELPPKAVARFLGMVSVKASGVPYDRILRPITVKLVKHDDQWLIESYELRDRNR